MKNFWNYRSYISRLWFLLAWIWILLLLISLVKGIQILVFIPAFVLSIFLYAGIEYWGMKKNIQLKFEKIQGKNILKIYVKKNKKYNFIFAHKKSDGSIEFLYPERDMSYMFDETQTYDFYLYAFGKFDIIRNIFHIWKYNFSPVIESETFQDIKKYQQWDIIDKLDMLKTSVYNTPYLRISSQAQSNLKEHNKLFIYSNISLQRQYWEHMLWLHIFLLMLWVCGVMIEWEDTFLRIFLWWSILLFGYLKWKYNELSDSVSKKMIVSVFFLMILWSIIYRDMSWMGSIFLLQLLCIVLLTKKSHQNSFLFLFLILFVFVAISLFSSQIRFLFLFLCFLCAGVYLLFFISWDETFLKKIYKFWNDISWKSFIKTFWIIIVWMMVFYFVLPHGKWMYQTESTWFDTQNSSTISGFSDEINLTSVGEIAGNNKKVFVLENMDDEKMLQFWLEYFRWMRFETFDGMKWKTLYKNSYQSFSYPLWTGATLPLSILYYPDNGENFFIPRNFLKFSSDSREWFYYLWVDSTILRTQQPVKDNIRIDMEFALNTQWQLRDVIHEKNEYKINVWSEVEKLFEKFFAQIPEDIQKTPKALTQYIKYKAWFAYSVEAPAQNISDFLYGVKQWHCEYFATVLAVTLQHFWYQATLVNGFSRGEYNELANSYIFRWKNAHSWVEILNPQTKNWDIYDATPVQIVSTEIFYKKYLDSLTKIYDYIDIKWYMYVVNYTLQEQKDFFMWLYEKRNIFAIIFIWSVFMLLFYQSMKKFFFFVKFSQKEKMMFLISKVLKIQNFPLQELEKYDLQMAKKYRESIYHAWDIQIWYYDFFCDLYVLWKIKKYKKFAKK